MNDIEVEQKLQKENYSLKKTKQKNNIFQKNLKNSSKRFIIQSY